MSRNLKLCNLLLVLVFKVRLEKIPSYCRVLVSPPRVKTEQRAVQTTKRGHTPVAACLDSMTKTAKNMVSANY